MYEFNNDAMSEDFKYTLKMLKEYHKEYARHIDQREWYAEASLINFDGIGCSGHEVVNLHKRKLAIDSKRTNPAGFWIPHPSLHEHMAYMAVNECIRLKDVKEEEQNPDFDNFPIKHDSKLRQKEIVNSVRISLFDSKSLRVCKATYLDQIGTNITPDTPITRTSNDDFQKRTLREIDTNNNGALLPYSRCNQANTIGVSAIAIDKHEQFLFPLRASSPASSDSKSGNVLKRLGAMNGGWHCFSSGVLEWGDIERSLASKNMGDFCRGLTTGIKREILMETGCTPSADDYDIVPYAYARELKRAGKPQFFFIVRFNKYSADELRARIDKYAEEGLIKEIYEYVQAQEPAEQKILLRMFRKQKEKQRRVFWQPPLNLAAIKDINNVRRFSDTIHEGNSTTYELYASLYLLNRATAYGRSINWSRP